MVQKIQPRVVILGALLPSPSGHFFQKKSGECSIHLYSSPCLNAPWVRIRNNWTCGHGVFNFSIITKTDYNFTKVHVKLFDCISISTMNSTFKALMKNYWIMCIVCVPGMCVVICSICRPISIRIFLKLLAKVFLIKVT